MNLGRSQREDKHIKAVPVFVVLILFSLSAVLALNASLPFSLSAFSLKVSAASSNVIASAPCETAVISKDGSISQNIAIQNAESSPLYLDLITGSEVATYRTTFTINNWTDTTCAVTVQSMNVVFTVENSTALVGSLVVTENPVTLTPIASDIQSYDASASTCSSPCSSPIWAGYEAYGNSGATDTLYQAVSDFNQSTISYPSTTGGCSDSNTCTLSEWVGLEDTSQASNGYLAQAGTYAICEGSGSPGCGTKLDYYAFFETLGGSGLTECTAANGGQVNISGGDSMYAAVTNEAGYGLGGSDMKYDFYIDDSTSSTSCDSTGNSYNLPYPTMAAFIVENTETCGINLSCASLAQFGSATFSNPEVEDYTASTYPTLYSLDQSGYAWYDVMENYPASGSGCGGIYTTNVGVGSVWSPNYFTTTWFSSQYADWWQTGC